MNLNEKSLIIPYEESGGDQQDGQVDSDSCLKVEGFEEGSSITHEN